MLIRRFRLARAGFDSFDIAAAEYLAHRLGLFQSYCSEDDDATHHSANHLANTWRGSPFGLLNVAGLQFAPISHAGAISLGCVPLITAVIANRYFGDRISLSHLIALGILLLALAVIWSAHPFQ